MRSFQGLDVLVVMTLVQMVMAAGSLILPAIAPITAAALGVDAALVGMQVSLVYGCAMVGAFFCGRLVARHGSCRMSQVALGLMAAGCCLASIPHVAAIALGSVFMGLGYGLPVPAASRLLLRFTDPAKRNLVFSLKQSGVPLGGFLAGIAAPTLSSSFGWHSPLFICSLACVLLIVFLQRYRLLWDADRVILATDAGTRAAAFSDILRSPLLKGLILVFFLLSAIQLCVVTFAVTGLVHDLGYDPVAAGLVLAGIQIASMTARIGWGWLADRIGSGVTVLLLLIFLLVVALLSTTALDPEAPVALVVTVFAVLGVTAVGWNGVLIAECARLSPPGKVADVASLTMVASYCGVLCGPFTFAFLQLRLGGVLATFSMLAIPALLALAGLAAVARRRP